MLRDLIKGEWMAAPFAARTDENGDIKFRGFYGQYEVIQQFSNRNHAIWELHLSEKQENIWTFVANLPA